MTSGTESMTSFAVAPAPVWRLLWLWVPMLFVMVMSLTVTLQSEQRTAMDLALLPFLLLVWGVSTWAFFRRRITLHGQTLEVVSTFYRKRVPVQDLQLDRARVVDLAEHGSLKPQVRTNGFGMPGFQSGHYRMRDRSRAFCLLTDSQRVLYLPLRGGSVLVLSPNNPRALLAALQALAAPGGTH